MSKDILKNLENEKKGKVSAPPSAWDNGGVLCGRLEILKSKFSSSFGEVLLTDQERKKTLNENKIEKQLYENISKQAVQEMKMRKMKLQELKTAKEEIESNLSKNNYELISHKNKKIIVCEKYAADKEELVIKSSKNLAEKNEKIKEINLLDPEISLLEEKLSTLIAKQKLLQAEAKKLDKETEKIIDEKKSLAKIFQKENLNLENQTKNVINEIEQWTMKLKENETETEKLISLDTNVKHLSTTESKPDQGEHLFIEHLTEQITKLEDDLSCPVCFETAQSPIYMCQESHLICQECRPKMKKCPECRIPYRVEKKIHRYAEKQLDELVKLREKKKAIMDRMSGQMKKEGVVNVIEAKKTDDKGDHKLLIGNIPDEVTINDLEQVFKKYGTLRKVNISVQCHRFGTVQFNDKAGFENALKDRNSISVRRKRLRVNIWANTRGTSIL